MSDLRSPDSADLYALSIAAALQQSLGGSHAAVKTVVSWTGANERTVKNWLSGKYGPSGSHLVMLARHSNVVLECFLAMANRDDLLISNKLAAVESAIFELLSALQLLDNS